MSKRLIASSKQFRITGVIVPATVLMVVGAYFIRYIHAGAIGGTSTACQFVKADQPLNRAFCESFDTAIKDPATRSGDLDAPLWGVSRYNSSSRATVNPLQGLIGNWFPTNLQGCGSSGLSYPTSDVRICNGGLVEGVNDGGTAADGQTDLAMYPRQPFDIAGRTGTAVFDVSDDSEGIHAAWPEWWYTDQPVPAPHGNQSAVAAYPRNGIGLKLTLQCGTTVGHDGAGNIVGSQVGVGQVVVVRNYESQVYGGKGGVNLPQEGCVNKGSITAGLNHFEVRLSQNSLEVWGADPGSTNVRKLTSISNLNLTFSRGVTWMEDVHYNGCKFNTQCDHTFVWDNFGFDGPKLDRDLGFDVADANVPVPDPTGQNSHITRLGYEVTSKPTTVQVKGVHQLQIPAAAIITFTWNPGETAVPSLSVNGNPYIATAWPFPAVQGDGGPTDGFAWSTIAVPVPLSEIKTDGSANTIAFKTPDAGGDFVVSNIDLILLGASPPPP